MLRLSNRTLSSLESTIISLGGLIGAALFVGSGTAIATSILMLFENEYRVACLMLFGLISVIQLFVYPSAWPDHIQWVAFMSILIARGSGVLSFEYLFTRIWTGRRLAISGVN